MKAITVGPSLHKFLNVVVRKNAEAQSPETPHYGVWGKRALDLGGGGGGLFLTFGFKYLFFRFWDLGSRGGCLWIFKKKIVLGERGGGSS
jgi:hypothetical protein